MSGHSKWSKVKHQKASTDVVKAKAFTKASRAITVAVREGGGITDSGRNFKLRLAIEQAKAVNMPKDTIDRAIAKGKGDSGDQLESLLYEAYGPEGVGLIISAATENRQRTVSAIKNVLDRHDGVLASPGAVSYLFERVGVIVIDKQPNKSGDELLAFALEIGADDIIITDDIVEIYTNISHTSVIKDTIETAGIPVHATEIIYRPKQPLSVPETLMNQVDTLREALEELDDVQEVYINLS